MNIKEILKEIISDFHQREFSGVKPRELLLPLDSGKIITAIGVRRSGKTFLLYDTIRRLKEKGVDRTSFILINFEDERLNLKSSDLDSLLQAYRELYPDKDMSKCYFFFDEIQNIVDWEKFVRRCYDSITKNIFITGSNSKLLSKDIATSLRGRTLTYDVFTLNFREYLNFIDVDVKNFSSRNKAKIRNAFNDYLFNGGFPETIHLDETLRNKTLQEYYNVMLYKDMIERYNITNTTFLKYFLERVLNNLGKPTSVNKIYNEIRSNNYKTNKNILYDILDWSESIYYLFRVYKFNYSQIDREKGDKKIFFIDNGLVNSLTYRFSNEYGKLLENIVAIHLKKEYADNLFYYHNGNECDFITFRKHKPEKAIQVCWDISDKSTAEREIKGLVRACEYLKLKKGLIVTNDLEYNIVTDNIAVDVVPVYKFLLL